MATYREEDLLEEELYCPVCFDEFNHGDAVHLPKMLTCLHTFCSKCLKELRKSDGSVECSLCRIVQQNVNLSELMDNYVMIDHMRKEQERLDFKFALEQQTELDRVEREMMAELRQKQEDADRLVAIATEKQMAEEERQREAADEAMALAEQERIQQAEEEAERLQVEVDPEMVQTGAETQEKQGAETQEKQGAEKQDSVEEEVPDLINLFEEEIGAIADPVGMGLRDILCKAPKEIGRYIKFDRKDSQDPDTLFAYIEQMKELGQPVDSNLLPSTSLGIDWASGALMSDQKEKFEKAVKENDWDDESESEDEFNSIDLIKENLFFISEKLSAHSDDDQELKEVEDNLIQEVEEDNEFDSTHISPYVMPTLNMPLAHSLSWKDEDLESSDPEDVEYLEDLAGGSVTINSSTVSSDTSNYISAASSDAE